MEYMNCGQEVSFNREDYYVGTANDKLIKISEKCKIQKINLINLSKRNYQQPTRISDF
jgi:hypothetical protein